VSWLLDFEYLNVFFGKLKFKKMPKFEILSALRGLKVVIMKALKKIPSCNDLRKKICTGSSKTFLRYPRNPPQVTRSCNSSLFDLLLGSLQNLLLCVSDPKAIPAQSWGHTETP